ncbi:MAG: hypothetical protein CTY26_03195 [Methylophilus sp.]|nr:MAG: hypothetical protein CTY26_03195 [Methylophilus sp.]
MKIVQMPRMYIKRNREKRCFILIFLSVFSVKAGRMKDHVKPACKDTKRAKSPREKLVKKPSRFRKRGKVPLEILQRFNAYTIP